MQPSFTSDFNQWNYSVAFDTMTTFTFFFGFCDSTTSSQFADHSSFLQTAVSEVLSFFCFVTSLGDTTYPLESNHHPPTSDNSGI